jgi:PAS domain S-box-containing protein
MCVVSHRHDPESDARAGRIEAGRLKILIIDDDPIDRAIFKQSLEADRPGAFIYNEAGLGRDGLSRLGSFQPDCVLLDFNLPDLDGLQMMRRLHEGRDFLPCAVVMLTGTGSEQLAVEAMKLGVMDYLAKGPASAQALSRTVVNAIQRFRLEQQIADQRRALEQRNRELEAIRAELFEEKERYRILAEAIPQLVWTADSEGSLHYANRRLWEFSGKASDGTNEGAWPLASLVHEDDMNELWDRWGEAVRSGRPFETEIRLHRSQDRTWRWHLMRTVPMRTTEEGPVRWFGTFTDIEDQRRAGEVLRQRQKLESIGLLAGGIAHDFNNLLVGIMGGASFALDSLEPDHPVYPVIEIVFRSSERAAHLTRQLLAYSGKGQGFTELVDVSRIARETGKILRSSIPGAISIAIDTAKDIPSIETDSGQMEQLIINLAMNGAEAIEGSEGVVSIETAVESIGGVDSGSNALGYQLPPGDYILIKVSDSGSGMDEGTKAQIFDPFFTTKFTGRGLGLAAVQGIVRSLEGGIQVSSAPGKGSTFRVLLPVKKDVEPAEIRLIQKKDSTSAARS